MSYFSWKSIKSEAYGPGFKIADYTRFKMGDKVLILVSALSEWLGDSPFFYVAGYELMRDQYTDGYWIGYKLMDPETGRELSTPFPESHLRTASEPNDMLKDIL